jgi:ABC-2 type transport system ATP-binding protein
MALIEVEHLVKEYIILKKKRGFKGFISGVFNPEKLTIRAVNDISFQIEKGEIVGYIGPNGAGKSTTIKMMTGILYPTSGSLTIGGISPHQDRKAVVKKLGVVFGQRTQLYWELRLGESFELLRRVYQIDPKVYQENLDTMCEVLKIDELLDIPVRQLSLGQRMKGDLAASMLHSPSILFLDEPTIGLDIDAKHAIRKFILEINRRYQVTVILTTHDLDDVEQLCTRLVVINHGIIVEDGPLEKLLEKLAPYRVLVVEMKSPQDNIFHPAAEVIKQEGQRVWLKFEKNKITAAELIYDLAKVYPLRDISIQEPNIEDIIREVYKSTSKI